ncbi:uncharacterized protein GGS22DRAFT_71783 [Annulohypoxylon maeteangense]|uniref:uncharacterized protein n=1 Tax=Annulohypoxylon maeteangense TaxID=1927788 RepID=UPI00200812F8|nr:uncharacterized protein GGS22DRAFT_71783 [Annulohypoxylon maeteangense]KAI0881191.1 hypothetical protein GGS22DRAFT_71783 [Annulohypoxylon maeteangense]
MEKKSSVLRRAQGIINYYDAGLPGLIDICCSPGHIYDAADAFVTAQGNEILHIQLPHNSRQFLILSQELLDGARNLYGVPCTWFFGSNRLFQRRYNTPRAKMLSLVSSMIKQLIDILPRRFEDPDMALSRRVFNSLRLHSPDMSITIPAAVRIIIALINVIPTEILFFFEGCNDLALLADERPLDEACNAIGDLLRFLARDEPGRPRKILWIETGTSAAFIRTITVTMNLEKYTNVAYPADWDNATRSRRRSRAGGRATRR